MLILPPDEASFREWESDFNRMKSMLYGDVDELSALVARIQAFQESYPRS